jgi:hypothetical protein
LSDIVATTFCERSCERSTVGRIACRVYYDVQTRESVCVCVCVCRDNLDLVFKRNGFDFKDDPNTGALMLTAVPYVK